LIIINPAVADIRYLAPATSNRKRNPTMITRVKGDILLSDAQTIAHGVAPGDHFNQGLALALRDLYPSMSRDFRAWCHQSSPKAGAAWLWAGPERVVVNLLTQEPATDKNGHPGAATLHNIDHALKDLVRLIEKEKLTSVALPRLATGVGGMKWDDVLPLIEKHLGGLDIPVLVYETYVPATKGDEKLPKAA
jgi:O-acetyl-ADP-ribose deacetylase (regulator of RNase III)